MLKHLITAKHIQLTGTIQNCKNGTERYKQDF